MAYLDTARELQKNVDAFLETFVKEENRKLAAVELGHIVNLSVRCNPRQPQGTVRKNIVSTAMNKWCDVSMTRESENGKQFNKIHISVKDDCATGDS